MSKNLTDDLKIRVTGHLKVEEYESMEDCQNGINGKILGDKFNSVHPENLSIVLARGLADQPNGSIYSMWFGSGGATIDPLGNILFATPNTEGAAGLNIPLYFEIVDQNNGAPTGNSMTVRHINGTLFSDVEIRCIIDKNAPFGQLASDNLSGTNLNTTPFTFSEIGLFTQDGLLTNMIVFAPITKSSNRVLQIIFTIRIRIIP